MFDSIYYNINIISMNECTPGFLKEMEEQDIEVTERDAVIEKQEQEDETEDQKESREINAMNDPLCLRQPRIKAKTRVCEFRGAANV